VKINYEYRSELTGWSRCLNYVTYLIDVT